MNTKTILPANRRPVGQPDPAAVFAAALSLWAVCQKQARHDSTLNFSEHYRGMDEFMRVVMRVANQFERWSCRNLNFAELDQPWPYLLQDHFGEDCLEVVPADNLVPFDDDACLCVAIKLRLPVRLDKGLPVPVDVRAANPWHVSGSGFREYRIQTVRDGVDEHCVPYTCADDPFDGSYGDPYFGLYGVNKSGLLEHIADRPTYAKVLSLAQKLVPGLKFRTS
jgi:hypothetical protein